MIYVISSKDGELLKNKIAIDIKKKFKELNEFNYQSFDMYNDLIQDGIDACSQSSFFDGGKVVVCNNCYFLSSDQTKAPTSWNNKQDLTVLEKYLTNQNPDCDLYLTCTGRLLGETSSKLIKALKKNASVSSIDELTMDGMLDEGLSYVGNKGYNIDREALYEVIKRVDGDYSLFIQTLDKLMCYTDKIRLEDVEVLVAPKLEDNVFNIIENLMKFAIKDAVKSYRDLTSQGTIAMRLLPIFASQFSFLFEVSKLLEVRKRDAEIAAELKCKPMRITFSKKAIGQFSSSDILHMMADLGKIEEHVKYDLDDPDTALELFILNFRKNYVHKR